jgi:hypothetical protein
MRIVQARYGAVVEHLAMIVTPTQIRASADLQFRDVPDHDARQEIGRILPVYVVFEKRTYIDEARSMSQSVVLTLVTRVIRANGVVARPVLVKEAATQLGGA